jgi:hypothetical protein
VAQRFHQGFATYRPWQGEPHDDGGAFECWLATLLLTAGATRVLWSCEGRDEQGNSVFESDVVALHGDRLVFYDVKLQAPDGGRKTEQIRAVRETAMRLGGLSAAPVLVRPNWPATAHVEQFASVLGVKVLHRAHLASLVPELLSPLGIRADGSEVLARVQETLARLDRDASRERTVFLHRKPASKPMGSRRVLR